MRPLRVCRVSQGGKKAKGASCLDCPQGSQGNFLLGWAEFRSVYFLPDEENNTYTQCYLKNLKNMVKIFSIAISCFSSFHQFPFHNV